MPPTCFLISPVDAPAGNAACGGIIEPWAVFFAPLILIPGRKYLPIAGISCFAKVDKPNYGIELLQAAGPNR